MGQHYSHLSLEERCHLASLHAAGCSLRQMAAALDRPPSTVARELKRNAGAQARSHPAYAHEQARARRWQGARLERAAALRTLVLDRLGRGWSPEQVAGRFAREHRATIRHESIYRFLYAQLRRTKDYTWRLYLPRGKSQRGWRGRRGGTPVQPIPERVPLTARPATVAPRQEPGHWESDLMLFARYGQAVLVAHERTSRLLLVTRQPNKRTRPTIAQLAAWLAPLPPALRQTMTFDNGTEFTQHHQLTRTLGIATYFCDPHSPWQKGGIENALGRLRRPLPRKTDLATLATRTLTAAVQAYNNTPRKCLGFRTPAEVFATHLLHFQCESTFPRARE